MRTPDDYRYEREGFSLLNRIGIELEKQKEAEAKHKREKQIQPPEPIKPKQLLIDLDI